MMGEGEAGIVDNIRQPAQIRLLTCLFVGRKGLITPVGLPQSRFVLYLFVFLFFRGTLRPQKP